MKHDKFMAVSFFNATLLAIGGCSTAGPRDTHPPQGLQPTTQGQSSVGNSTATTGCDLTAVAGGGWVNTSIPQSTGSFDVQFDVLPSTQGNPHPATIDGVIGLSNGPALGFTSLGPIVRFNPGGNIDVRNGTAYEGAYPYEVGDGLYTFKMSVDLPSHTYSVWVKHPNPGYPFEQIANAFAFRTEQGSVTRLDTMGRFVDGAQGTLQTCAFAITPKLAAEGGGGSSGVGSSSGSGSSSGTDSASSSGSGSSSGTDSASSSGSGSSSGTDSASSSGSGSSSGTDSGSSSGGNSRPDGGSDGGVCVPDGT